jgi:hypothetical protein
MGFEVFEFIEPNEKSVDNFGYWETGLFHICLADLNIKEITQRIVKPVVNKELKYGD